jgi:MFS family permease
MRTPRIVTPLRHRDFRLLWIGQTVSMVGSWAHSVALPFQILALGGSAIQLGISVALFSGVSLVVILFGGAVADRLPRRRLILGSDLACGLVVSVVAFLGLTHQLQIWQLYVESVLFGAASSFYLPAMTAIIPDLVSKETLVAANALRGLSRQGARVVGPLGAGLLVAFAGPPPAFAFNAATFFISFGALLMTSQPAGVAATGQRILTDVWGGVRFTFSIPWLWVTIFGFALINAAMLGPIIVGLPLLVKHVLLADARVFGVITAAIGLGEASGGIIVTLLPQRRAGPAMYAAEILAAIALAGFGFFPSLGPILVCGFFNGVGLTVFQVIWESALQRHVPTQMLGRVSSVDYFGALLLLPIAPIAFGVAIQRYPIPDIFIVSGLAAAVLCALALLVPSIRELD